MASRPTDQSGLVAKGQARGPGDPAGGDCWCRMAPSVRREWPRSEVVEYRRPDDRSCDRRADRHAVVVSPSSTGVQRLCRALADDLEPECPGRHRVYHGIASVVMAWRLCRIGRALWNRKALSSTSSTDPTAGVVGLVSRPVRGRRCGGLASVHAVASNRWAPGRRSLPRPGSRRDLHPNRATDASAICALAACPQGSPPARGANPPGRAVCSWFVLLTARRTDGGT